MEVAPRVHVLICKYTGLKVVPLYRYFGAKVYTIWVYGPLGLRRSEIVAVIRSPSRSLSMGLGLKLLLQGFRIWIQDPRSEGLQRPHDLRGPRFRLGVASFQNGQVV